MNCPTCNCKSHVRATRGTERHRECPRGHRFVTDERVVQVGARKPGRQPGPAVRRMPHDMDVRAARELHLGWDRLAQEWSISRSAVYEAARRGRAFLAGAAP